MKNRLRIEKTLLETITDKSKERNMYVHDMFLARDIFWQRLDFIMEYLIKYAPEGNSVLDLGGGSGMLCKPLSSIYPSVDIIDVDITDANNIKNYYNLMNVNLISSDIADFNKAIIYDVIIAADVLEHFHDLRLPIEFIKNHTDENSVVVVSLPTENVVYSLGRSLVRKQKPIDHYHKSKDVLLFMEENGFKVIDLCFCPKYILSIPLFQVGVLQKIK